MACPVVIPLDQSLHFSPAQIGSLGVTLGKLFSEDIPIPETIVIPPETLYRLTQENRLYALLSENSPELSHDAARNAQFKKKIQQVICTQKLPGWFVSEILTQFNRKFRDGFISIQPGNYFPKFATERFQHIQGEANSLESLLLAWAELIYLCFEKHMVLRPIHFAPAPLILQAQHQAIVSGLGHTLHPQKLSKTQVFIQAIWGSPDQHLLMEESDSYSVDVRTWGIIDQQVATKTKQYRRESDSLISVHVPQQYQKQSVLNPAQITAIAQIIFAIKQCRLEHQVISWELAKEGVFVTGIRESQIEPTVAHATKKTVTKLYISTGNPQKHLPALLPTIDGIGVLRSEYTLAKFGVHPMHVIQSKQKVQLLNELVTTITTYQSALHRKPVIYRSQNFTSSELRQLRYSENYEPAEANPYIGYRGGLQLVRQPQLLEFELEVLKAVLSRSPAPLGFMPAFVRTPHEMEWILAEIERAGLFQQQNFSVWLQLNTPENILNLRSYPTHKLAGISVNVTSLHALLLGIDPDNPEIHEHYAMDTLAVERMLEQLALTVRELQDLRNFTQPLQLHLHLEKYSHDLVALAVKLGYHGITVKPAAAQITHATIVEIEEKQLAYLQ